MSYLWAACYLGRRWSCGLSLGRIECESRDIGRLLPKSILRGTHRLGRIRLYSLMRSTVGNTRAIQLRRAEGSAVYALSMSPGRCCSSSSRTPLVDFLLVFQDSVTVGRAGSSSPTPETVSFARRFPLVIAPRQHPCPRSPARPQRQHRQPHSDQFLPCHSLPSAR